MHKRDSSTLSQNSHANYELCQCQLCIRPYQTHVIEDRQLNDFADALLPNMTAYKFICDIIVNSPICSKLSFSIIDTFFFQSRKEISHYHNDQDGKIIKQQVKGGLKQVQRILRNKKHIPLQPPVIKIQIKYETAKDTVNRKIKNNIGIMVINDGTYKYLNELNISHQISSLDNVCFIKSFHTCKLIPIYYKYQDVTNKQFYKRARTYLKGLARQITPFEINYITKQQEYSYQQDLYRHNFQKYLLYLTCKLCHLILNDECLLVRTGVFVWAVDSDTSGIYIANAHEIRYSMQKDPNQILDKFVNNKRQRVQKKLKALSHIQLTRQPSTKMKRFQYLLKQSFQAMVKQLAPNIEIDHTKQIQANQAFKKFHPNVKYQLSDIIRNNQTFDSQMKKLFFKRSNKRTKTVPKSITTQITSKKQHYSNRTLISPTQRKLKPLKISSQRNLLQDQKNQRGILIKSSSRFPKYRTQYSGKKLCF